MCNLSCNEHACTYIMMIPINLQQDIGLDWDMIIISVSTCSTFFIYHFWYYCVEMVNVSCTDIWSKSSPKLFDPIFKFFGLNVFLKYCFSEPQTFSTGFRSGDSSGVAHQFTPCFSKKFNPMACMFGIIILQQMMAIRIMIPQKWKKTSFKYRYKAHPICAP